MITRLQTCFDNESVETALREFEKEPSSFDSWMIRILLQGRGAQSIWLRIEERLKSDLSLCNIAILSHYLPRNEIVELIAGSGISDEWIIQEIKEGKFPVIDVLPKERRVRIIEILRNIVMSDINAEFNETILLFLLGFDRGPNPKEKTNEQSVDVATEWCLRFRDDERIQQVLGRLLWQCPKAEIIRIAEDHVLNFKVNKRTTFLTTDLMKVTGRRRSLYLLDHWFDHSDSDTDELICHVISRWIFTTNGSREALKAGKDVIKDSYPGRYGVFFILIHFYSHHRKVVRRWMTRYVKSHTKKWFVRQIIPDILREYPTRRNCALAKQVLKETSDVEQRHSILLALVKHSKDQDIVDLAKQDITNYPNAPRSFSMMCEIAKFDPGTAVPWITEWINTALPDQACDGLLVIATVSPTAENLKLVRDWLSTCDKNRLPVPTLTRAKLLERLLAIDPCTEDHDRASALIDSVSNSQHRIFRKLVNRLNKATQ